MRCLLSFLLIVITLFLISQVHARVIHVPSDSSTIQGGINGAVDGDTVLVADDTYTGDGNRDIDFLGKAIVVMSENGPEVTIVDCEADSLDPHRGFNFQSGEDSRSVVKGFTIRNGFATYNGGGIFCYSSSPTIKDICIADNVAGDNGGGIYCYWYSSPIIENSAISGNIAKFGGGIYCNYYSNSQIINNTISDNSSIWLGGGLACYQSSPAINNNVITGNTAGDMGGGIYCVSYSAPTITNNTITDNVASHGGAIKCRDHSSPNIEGNTIARNLADCGGGVDCTSASPTIESNVIAKNRALDYGGGIRCYSSYASIEHNTIFGNTAGIGGGGIYCIMYASPTVVNTILWDNESETGKEVYISQSLYPSALTIYYSDVEEGMNSVHVDSGCVLYWGEGMIDNDPLLVYPDKCDYRLLWESPCIDRGHPAYPFDPDGTRSDMGAFFFDQDDYNTLYLTPDTTDVVLGGQLGVTYTVINRWAQPESFWGLTQAILPDGSSVPVLGPTQFTLPASRTIQRHFNHYIPSGAPIGEYEYWTQIGLPPSTLYDEDRFTFTVIE